MRILLTVSPVPLTATASTQHVLAATVYSKSVLRAAAGELYSLHQDVDYFPSYEIVASPFLRTKFFEKNMRSVSKRGVDLVMHHFFAAHELEAAPQRAPQQVAIDVPEDDPVCEDALLEAFGPR